MSISKEEFKSYINNTLSAVQKKEVDQYLLDYPLERRSIEGAIEYQESHSFEELLDEVDSLVSASFSTSAGSDSIMIVEEKEARLRRLIPRWIITAAAAVLIIFLIRTQLTNTSLELNDYFDAYPDVITNVVRGQNTIDANQKLIKAMEYYNAGDLKNANALLTPVHASDEQDAEVTFYLAITELAQGSYGASLEKFEALTKPGVRFQYDDGALWYRALCLVHLNRYEEATPILQKISKSNHYKKEAALSLLDEL